MWQMQLAAHWMGAGVLGRAAGRIDIALENTPRAGGCIVAHHGSGVPIRVLLEV